MTNERCPQTKVFGRRPLQVCILLSCFSAISASVAAAEPQRTNGLNEKKIEDLSRQRFFTYTTVMLDWTQNIISLGSAQKSKIGELCQSNINLGIERLHKTTTRFANSKRQRIEGLVRTSPLHFTQPSGSGDRLDLVRFDKPVEPLRTILNSQQLTSLTNACAERKQFQMDCMVSQVINVLDGELFLTTEQREDLRQVLPEQLKRCAGRAVALHPNTAVVHHVFGGHQEYRLSNYYVQEPIGPLLREQQILKPLTATQRVRANQLAAIGTAEATHVGHNELFIGSKNPAAWQDHVRNLTERFTETLTQACAVRVEYQAQRKELTEPDVHYLAEMIDAVAKEIIEQWSADVSSEFENQKRRLAATKENHAVWFWIPAPEVSDIDGHPKWQKALDRIFETDTEVTPDPRGPARRRDNAATIVGFLDKELWLQKHQREPLMKLVSDALPENGGVVTFRNRLGDLSLLTVALRSEAELSMLTTQQKDVWKMLSGYFEITPRTVHMLDSDGNYSRPIEILR